MQKAWFNIYNVHEEYHGSELPFAEPTEFRWAKEFEENYEVIYAELKEYLKNNNLVGHFIKSMVSRENSWKTIPLRTWGIQQFKNQKHFPITYSLIQKYPEITSSSFNLLEAKSKIHPHLGDTNTIYRCHLGLDIPAGLSDCAFRVKKEIRPWQNGKWMMFIDAYNHESYNNSDRDRFIFVVDVVRNEFKNDKAKICATVMTSQFLQKRWQKYPILKKLSAETIKFLAKCLHPFTRLAIVCVNVLKVY